MSLRPLGHRVLVLPDEQDDATASGLILPTDRHHVPTSGTVIELGDGPTAAQRVRQATIARCMSIVNEMEELFIKRNTDPVEIGVTANMHSLAAGIREEMRRYKNIPSAMPGVEVGDRVVFPVESGLNIDVDGVRHIILNEDDVAVIANEDEVAA